MIGADVSASGPNDAGQRVRDGVRRGMERAADAGFAVAFDAAPSGATNTLKHSGVQPTWDGDTLRWGFTAPYAADVEFGQDPHVIPIDEMPALELWARRVLGDETLAWPVRNKIASEGTQEQRYVRAGVIEQRRVLQQDGIAGSISDEFRG